MNIIKIKPLKKETDYEEALERIDDLMDAELDTPEGDELDVLVTLVQAYEAKHYSIEAPDPIEAIKFVMENRNLTRKDLEPCIGSRGRVSEIMNRKRGLSIEMIGNLHKEFRIPLESLISV